jgi:hypothetical protein
MTAFPFRASAEAEPFRFKRAGDANHADRRSETPTARMEGDAQLLKQRISDAAQRGGWTARKPRRASFTDWPQRNASSVGAILGHTDSTCAAGGSCRLRRLAQSRRFPFTFAPECARIRGKTPRPTEIRRQTLPATAWACDGPSQWLQWRQRLQGADGPSVSAHLIVTD